MRREIQGPKEEVRKMYKELVGDERYTNVRIIEPLVEMPTKGTWKMVVETTTGFTDRGFFG